MAKKGMPRRSGAGVRVITTCYDKHADTDQLQSTNKDTAGVRLVSSKKL